MKPYFEWKNIIIGRIDQKHPQAQKMSEFLEEAFTSISKAINEEGEEKQK